MASRITPEQFSLLDKVVRTGAIGHGDIVEKVILEAWQTASRQLSLQLQPKPNAEQLGRLVSDFANSYDRAEVNAFVSYLANDHPTLQQSVARCFLSFFRTMAKHQSPDGRNEQAVALAKRISEAEKDTHLVLR